MAVTSHNLHRNAAYALKRILSDGTFGLGELVDAASFDLAAKELQLVGLPVDFTTREARPVSDILKDLCIIRGIELHKNAAGRWTIAVDSLNAGISAIFGLNDGYYNNIASLDSYTLMPVEERTKKVVLKYRYFPNVKGELTYNAMVSRDVSGSGSKTLELENPYIIEHETADKVVDYLSKKIGLATTTVQLTVGQEGRNLRLGDVIQLIIPHLNIDEEIFKITRIEYNIAKTVITGELYSAEIFNFTPGPYPIEENIPTGDDRNVV